jgi:ferredoxin
MQENKIKKVNLNQEKCIGCGACGITAPDAFGYDQSNAKAFVKEGAENTDTAKIQDATDRCPVQAISLEK